jgi:hypothetical protein
MKKNNILKYSDVSMYIDQYKYTYYASSRKELIKAVSPYGSPKVSIMYQDKKDGSSVRVGYIIGDHWLTEYKRVERAIE